MRLDFIFTVPAGMPEVVGLAIDKIFDMLTFSTIRAGAGNLVGTLNQGNVSYVLSSLNGSLSLVVESMVGNNPLLAFAVGLPG